MNVAFLGLGRMGGPMALNILRKGHSLAVWNRTPQRAAELVAAGARQAPTPADAARGCEIVITMLADVAAVESVLAGHDGVVEGMEPGTVVVDMSTVDRATARRMNDVVTERGGEFVDAPVSGSRKPAEDATLVILAGGAVETVDRVEPVLACMGRVIRMGGVGQGMAMKLVLNMMGAHMMTAFAAGLALGQGFGLEPRAMLEVIRSGAFSSPMYAAKGDKILRRDFRADFTLALLRKDQELVLKSAAELGYPMPTEEAVLGVLDQALAAGYGGEDMCALVRLFESWVNGPRPEST